jgi:hypothetical protein
MNPAPQFIQGVFSFEGRGFDSPLPLDPPAAYKVPRDKRAQPIYVRGGNSSDQLIVLLLLRDGKVMRYFPIGARSDMHVSLAVVEDIFPETELEIQLAAPKGATGVAIVDFGVYELD